MTPQRCLLYLRGLVFSLVIFLYVIIVVEVVMLRISRSPFQRRISVVS